MNDPNRLLGPADADGDNVPTPSPSNIAGDSANELDNMRTCWICYETEEENLSAAWVKPCRCRGSTKWVHQSCLKQWIDSKQRGDFQRPVVCPQCRTKYIIIFPNMSTIGHLMDVVDNMVNRLCPFFAAGALVGSLYLSAVLYGSVTLVQVVGPKKGFELLKSGNPRLILVGLPAIPAALVFERVINWGNVIFRFIHGVYNIARATINFILRVHPPAQSRRNLRLPIFSFRDPTTRIISGALLLPTIAATLGHVLFYEVKNKLYRVLLGGYTYLVVYRTLDSYLWAARRMRKRRRRVIDYPRDVPANNQN